MRERSSAQGLVAFIGVVAAIVVCVAQVSFAPWMQVRGAIPDLLVATTVALALHFGPWMGVFWGLGVGGLADVLAAHPLGILALPLAAVGYGAGMGHRLVLESRVLAPLGIGLVAALLHRVLQIPLALLWGYPVVVPAVLDGRGLIAVVYTALWTWACFLLLLVGHRLRKRERLAL